MSLIITAGLHRAWQSAVLAQTAALQHSFLQDPTTYILPWSRTVEPPSEEFSAVCAALLPTAMHRQVNAQTSAAILAATTASIGSLPEHAYPMYYALGYTALPSNPNFALAIPDMVGLALVYERRFPMWNDPAFMALQRGHRHWNLEPLPDSLIGKVLLHMFERSRLHFTSIPADRPSDWETQPDSVWCHRDTPLVNGRYPMAQVVNSAFSYRGCVRLATPDEIRASFAEVPEGTIIRDTGLALRDYFCNLGDDTASEFTRAVRLTERRGTSDAPTIPSPASRTTVSAQSFPPETVRLSQSARSVFRATTPSPRASRSNPSNLSNIFFDSGVPPASIQNMATQYRVPPNPYSVPAEETPPPLSTWDDPTESDSEG